MENHQYKDGDLSKLNPNDLKDMSLGGNVRRKQRANWNEFVESIRQQGVIQPVVVRLMPDSSFELLAGYGRRDASILLGFDVIPVVIRICDDATALQIHLSENLDRADLTFSDQVVWARKFISLYNGDVKSAAQRLNWSESKLRERLALAPCTEGVLDALDDGAITVKHALILAAFIETVQTNTLAKIISEKWSVNELKQRADRVQIPLEKAIFSKVDCQTCIHNTELQSGLFEMGSSAQCSKSSCYHEKTKAALESEKSKAEERFGTVLWLSQSMPEHRATVTPVIVGQAQFETGCVTCTKRVVVMDDAPHGNPGAIIESQCTDQSCLNECTASFEAFKAEQAKAVAEENTDADTQNESSENVASITQAKTPKKDKSPAVTNTGSISNVLVETHWKELRQSGGARLVNDPKFALVMQLLGVMQISKFKHIGDPAFKMETLMNYPDEKLKGMINHVVQYCATTAATIDGYDANKVITAATMALSDGKDVLVKSWVPTEATLNKYVTLGLEQIIKLSGLDVFVEAKEKGAGKKLSQGKKSDVIKNILSVTDFDWSDFAPPAYTSLMEKFQKGNKADAA